MSVSWGGFGVSVGCSWHIRVVSMSSPSVARGMPVRRPWTICGLLVDIRQNPKYG